MLSMLLVDNLFQECTPTIWQELSLQLIGDCDLAGRTTLFVLAHMHMDKL